MVKPDNYVMLLGWMRTELNLKGNELNLYAIIYGFTQDGETEFSGSIRYMQEWLGAESKQTVFNTLDKLIKKGLVQKRTEVVNGIKHNYYLAAPRGSLKIRPPQSNFYTGVVQNLDHPSPNFRPNNIEDNIEDNTLSLEVKHFGLYGNVILNDELYDRLLIESEEYADEYINRLDSHIEMHQLHKQYSAYAPNQFFIKIFDMLRRDGHVEV